MKKYTDEYLEYIYKKETECRKKIEKYVRFVFDYKYFTPPAIHHSKRKQLIKKILSDVFDIRFDLEIKNNNLRIINKENSIKNLPNADMYLILNKYLTQRSQGEYLIINGECIPKFDSIQITGENF